MDSFRPLMKVNVSNINCGNPQEYKCFQCESCEDGTNGVPEIISPSKIYSCRICYQNFSSPRKLEKHELKKICDPSIRDNSSKYDGFNSLTANSL